MTPRDRVDVARMHGLVRELSLMPGVAAVLVDADGPDSLGRCRGGCKAGNENSARASFPCNLYSVAASALDLVRRRTA